jgi:hypothetical protein
MRTFKLRVQESVVYRTWKATVVLSEYSVDNDRNICLTHECQTVEQLREEVERLKRELDSVLALGIAQEGR